MAKYDGCLFDGCLNIGKHSSGLCHSHYLQNKRGESLKPLRSKKRKYNLGDICSIEDCLDTVDAAGMCRGHYLQKYHNKPIKPIKFKRAHKNDAEILPSGRKGRYDDGGYCRVVVKEHPFLPNGTFLEHRLVMAEHLGRPLLSHETVHHKNGIRDDNEIENLELWSKSQPAGQRVEDKLEWAKWFVSQYEA